jgi:RimJ/RimL family protein N-acetyltransferase
VPPLAPGALDALRTERLQLLRPGEGDRAEMAAMHADEAVMATLGGVKTAAESDAIFDRLVAHWQAHDFGYWVARDPEDGRFAGRGGLRHLAVEGEPVVEVGYALMSDYWGRGLATEIARACVRAAFLEIGLRELVCFTTTTNQASQHVMEKAGFVYEKDFEYAGLPHRLCRLDAARWRAGADDG